MTDDSPSPDIRHYYVDEAGDPNLFKHRGKVIVGKDGCSSYFILGLADVANPIRVSRGLTALREKLVADPYFKGVPSFEPARKRTALAFHAKDDLPEVRRDVFQFLRSQEIRFYAVVRNKQVIVDKIGEHLKTKPTYKYHPNQLYDRCVSRMFRDRLHKADGYKIHFARRGSSDRTEALQNALSAARFNIKRKYGIEATAPVEINAGEPRTTINLQVVDYYLWALQRLYERREDRFLRMLWQQVGLIHDVDDTSSDEYGVYYTKKKQLTVESLE